MEKDPSKKPSSDEIQTKWDEMADFQERIKKYREATKAAAITKESESVKESAVKDIDTVVQAKESAPEVKESEPAQTEESVPVQESVADEEVSPDQVKEADMAQAQELERAQGQASELESAKAQELELAEAQELETAEGQELESQTEIEKELNAARAEFVKLDEAIREIEELENAYAEFAKTDNEINKYNKDLRQELAAVNQELEDVNKQIAPLIAISADWTHDKKEMAHDLAEQTLNAEVAKSGVIGKIWKGTLFKKYYEKKYEKEFLAGKRTNEDGKTLKDLIREESPAVMERFVMGAVEDERYIHGASGEKLIEADEQTNNEIKEAIKQYARTSLKKGEKVADLDREFLNDMGRIMEDAIKDNRMEKGYKRTNYLEVAKEAARRYEKVAVNAKSKAEHEKALAEVMAGFQAYHADVRSNVRTEAHRDAIDKITNFCENIPGLQLIPAEIVAGAAGAAVALTQTGIRAVFGAAGGVVGAGVISGLKERNRVTEDRARMLRDVANGKDYEGTLLSDEEIKKMKGADKKIAKHEARIGGTLYDMRKASELTDRINLALHPEDGQINQKELLSAIAEARVRIDISDAESKDLISYSSDQDRGKERLALDIAVIRAEKALNEKGQDALEIMKQHIEDGLYEDVDAKDKKFRNYRTAATLKQAGKTLLLGGIFAGASYVASQEVMAIADPNKIGIFEKSGILEKAGIKLENATDAKETLLASGFGQFRGSYEVPGASNNITTNASDPKLIKKLEADGYKRVTEVKKAWTDTTSELQSVDPSASTARIDVKYDSWASNGGLGTRIENGQFFSSIKGAATINGQSVNYSPDQLKAFITIGDSKFEIAGSLNGSGELVWGDGGVFTTTTGETIKAIGDNGEKLYKYFEIATVNNVDASGVQHIIPLATDVGRNTFSGKIEQLVETAVEHPAVYSFVKEIPGAPETVTRGITTGGFAFAPEFARTGLGEAISAPRTESEPIDTASASETPPEASEEPVEASETAAAPETPEVQEAPEETSESATAEPQPSFREALESVPEENIEVMPETPVEIDLSSETAPEAATEPVQEVEPNPEPISAPESESTPETDFEAWENDMIEDIESARAEIGDEGVAAFMEPGPITGDQQQEWRNWWNGLSEDTRNAVRELNDHITSSNTTYAYNAGRTFGVPFQTWLALNS